MTFIRPIAAVIALSLVAVAAGRRVVEETWVAAPDTQSSTAVCCTATCCVTTCCQAACCTAACCATTAKVSAPACCVAPVKASVAAPACCASPVRASAAAPPRGAAPVKTSAAAPACGSVRTLKTTANGPIELIPIEDSLQPVIDRFNADKDKPRVVTLLSPTCGGCVHAANALFAEALEAYPDESLSMLVIWEPMLGSDNEAAARASATIFDDPRVHQFWDGDRLSGITYSTEVYPQRMRQIAEAMPDDHFMKGHFDKIVDTSPERIPMWDFALFYPAGVEWTDTPPVSSAFIRQLAIFKTPEGTTATILTDDFTQPPIESDWFDEVQREMQTLMASRHETRPTKNQ